MLKCIARAGPAAPIPCSEFCIAIDPANVTVQWGGNASPAMNEILPGTTTKDSFVSQQAPVSIRVNSESVSNEIDESGLQYEK
jgi:hypothetical protein